MTVYQELQNNIKLLYLPEKLVIRPQSDNTKLYENVGYDTKTHTVMLPEEILESNLLNDFYVVVHEYMHAKQFSYLFMRCIERIRYLVGATFYLIVKAMLPARYVVKFILWFPLAVALIQVIFSIESVLLDWYIYLTCFNYFYRLVLEFHANLMTIILTKRLKLNLIGTRKKAILQLEKSFFTYIFYFWDIYFIIILRNYFL